MKRLLFSFTLLASLFVQSARAVFDSASQLGVLSSAVKRYYNLSGDFELSSSNPLPAIKETPTSVELVQLPESPSSTMPIHARYLKGSETVGELTASFRAVWRVNVFVARHPLARGSAANASDFEIQSLDRLALRQLPVETSVNLAEYELANGLSAGAPLTWNFLKPQPLVRKGSLVDVVAEEGGLKVTLRAVALVDAGRGETVAMRNPSTNKPFEATVINENLVKVLF